MGLVIALGIGFAIVYFFSPSLGWGLACFLAGLVVGMSVLAMSAWATRKIKLPEELVRPDLKPARADDTSITDPPELERAIEALQTEDFEQCVALAAPYADDAATRLSVDAHNLVALSLSRLNRYAEAVPHWMAVYDSSKTATHALQVATSFAMCRNLRDAEKWFELSNAHNAVSHEMSSALICSNFISALEQAGYTTEVFPHVQWLKGAYESLGVTDTIYLYQRGMPFLSVFLERSLPIAREVMDPVKLCEWYESMQPHLDEEGAAQVAAFVAPLKLAPH